MVPNGATMRFAAATASASMALKVAGQTGPPEVLQLGSVEPIQEASTETTRAASRALCDRTLFI